MKREFGADELFDIVQKLNGGQIHPIGSTEYDESAFSRQIVIQMLIDKLILDVFGITDYNGSQASVQKAKREAVKWLGRMRESIGDVFEEIEEGAEDGRK